MSLKPAEEKLLALHPCQQGGVGTVAGIDFGQRLPRQLGKDFGFREFEAEPDDKAVHPVCLRLFCVDPEFVLYVSRGEIKIDIHVGGELAFSSEEQSSESQSRNRISYALFWLKKK